MQRAQCMGSGLLPSIRSVLLLISLLLGPNSTKTTQAAHALYLLENSKSRALAKGIREVAGTMLRAEVDAFTIQWRAQSERPCR